MAAPRSCLASGQAPCTVGGLRVGLLLQQAIVTKEQLQELRDDTVRDMQRQNRFDNADRQEELFRRMTLKIGVL